METGYFSDHTVITDYEEAEPRVWTQQHLHAADILGPPMLTPPQVQDLNDINARGPCGMTPIMVAAVRGGGIDAGDDEYDSDSVEYFLNNLERLAKQDYTPTHADILHSRKATKGITEFDFPINNIPFGFVDVGGQRSQRRKWFPCFSSGTSNSSEFDQVLLEDLNTNRLEESRNIFDAIVNNQMSERVSII